MRRVILPLGSLLVAIVVAAIAVLFVFQSGDRPYLVAGNVDDFAVEEPVHFPDEQFYLVKLESGEFLALYTKDPHLGCTVPWNPNFEFQGTTGWFRNPCHAETYDIQGNLMFGPAPRGLDRFPVTVTDSEVRVHTDELICGPGAPPGMVCTP